MHLKGYLAPTFHSGNTPNLCITVFLFTLILNGFNINGHQMGDWLHIDDTAGNGILCNCLRKRSIFRSKDDKVRPD